MPKTFKSKPNADTTIISIKLAREERAEWERAAEEDGLEQISSYVKQILRMHLKEKAAKKGDKQPAH